MEVDSVQDEHMTHMVEQEAADAQAATATPGAGASGTPAAVSDLMASQTLGIDFTPPLIGSQLDVLGIMQCSQGLSQGLGPLIGTGTQGPDSMQQEMLRAQQREAEEAAARRAAAAALRGDAAASAAELQARQPSRSQSPAAAQGAAAACAKGFMVKVSEAGGNRDSPGGMLCEWLACNCVQLRTDCWVRY